MIREQTTVLTGGAAVCNRHDMPRLDPNDYADLDAWPHSWKFAPRDIRVGQRLVDLLFKPFLLHLADTGVSIRTFRRHADNLWFLGGELIRYAQTNARVRRSPEKALAEFASRRGGPVMLREGPQTQTEVDVTFRALMRFLRRSKPGAGCD
jgi:hypothetical protein